MADIKLGNLLYKNNTAPVDDSNPVSVKDEQAKDKLDEVKSELQSVDGKVATETTLGQIDQRLQTLEDTVEDGLQKVTLNGNIEKLNLDFDPLDPGDSEIIEISPGYLFSIEFLEVRFRAEGAEGELNFSMYTEQLDSLRRFFSIEDEGKRIDLTMGTIFSGLIVRPEGISGDFIKYLAYIRNHTFSTTNKLIFEFVNSTDQTTDRQSVNLFVKRRG